MTDGDGVEVGGAGARVAGRRSWQELPAGTDAQRRRRREGAEAEARTARNRAWMESGPFTPWRARMWALREMAAAARAPEGHGICGCLGRGDGMPACPCAMGRAFEWRGRWVRVRGSPFWMTLEDLGAVAGTRATMAGMGRGGMGR